MDVQKGQGMNTWKGKKQTVRLILSPEFTSMLVNKEL